MAIDAYVKFGEGTDTSPIYGTPLPEIEGDSDDTQHHWWCELRDCGFELENPEQDAEGEGADKDKKPFFKQVRLKKRVDWGSTQLFIKCCEAAEATTKKTDEEKAKGVIKQVTVHVCRPGGERKIPYVIVRYYGVRVTNYKLGMNGPESSEEITLEFDELEFEYQRTSPETNREVGNSQSTRRLDNFGQQKEGSGGSGGGGGGVTPTLAPGAPAPGGGAPAPAPVPGSNGTPTSGPANPTEAAAGITFPNLVIGAGPGVIH